MNNQKTVFNLCPVANHLISTDMNELQLQLNQDAVQATIDVCIHLTHLRNLTPDKLSPLQIVIQVVSQKLARAIPYQIISTQPEKHDSKISLQAYSSPFFGLHPEQNIILDQIVIFKIHVPIDHVETGNLTVVIGLQTVNQMSFDSSQGPIRIFETNIKFNSILYIDSFFSCSFLSYSICLEGNVFSHLLGSKYGIFNKIYRHHFYQAIDHMVISYNKLRQKINHLVKNYSYQNLFIQKVQQLPFNIDMNNYQEYQQIKNFLDKRNFQEQSMKQHRIILQSFIRKFIPQMTEKLLNVWKIFLQLINLQLTEQSKQSFYQKFSQQLKKRIEYRAITKRKLSQSQIQEISSNFQSFNSSVNNSVIVQTQTNSSSSFSENQIALNDLKQSFDDTQNTLKKRLIISNLELAYPTIKIRYKKQIKFNNKNKIQLSGPHIIVFVHGLGATSNAFLQFEYCVKNLFWKNVFVMNSICNQNFVDQQMEQMGNKLAIEVTKYIIQNNFGQNFQLSFIGHSLGGLIIRSALPRLQCYKYNMKSLITLSTPHLGYFYHNSALSKAGMWAICKFSKNQIMSKLLMSDSHNKKIDKLGCYRNSYLYSLSMSKGMNWFEHVMFCGSKDDYFVSPMSAFAQTKEAIKSKNDTESKIWEQMRINIQANLINPSIYKLLVKFNEKSRASIKDQLIGRASHILYLSSSDFIFYVLLVHRNLFI